MAQARGRVKHRSSGAATPLSALPSTAGRRDYTPAMELPARVRVYEVGPRDGLQNESAPSRRRPSVASSSSSSRPACARSRPPASSRRGPVPQLADADELLSVAAPRGRRGRRALSRPGRQPKGPRASRDSGRDRDGGLHRGERRVHDTQHRDDRDRVAGRLRAPPRTRRSTPAGGGAATSRPPSAARTAGGSIQPEPSRSAWRSWSSASTRSASGTPSASPSHRRSTT